MKDGSKGPGQLKGERAMSLEMRLGQSKAVSIVGIFNHTCRQIEDLNTKCALVIHQILVLELCHHLLHVECEQWVCANMGLSQMKAQICWMGMQSTLKAMGTQAVDDVIILPQLGECPGSQVLFQLESDFSWQLG